MIMKTKNDVRNTTAEVKHEPLMGLITAMGGGIEASEARGQAELVRSEVLPMEMSLADRAALESFGVVFGDPVEGDDLFVHAKLPAGWRKECTDHSMWSKLLDDKGRERAGIFYKAAFYDRRASLSVRRRYNVETEYPEQKKGGPYSFSRRCTIVLDGATLFDSGWMDPGEGKHDDLAREAAAAWLDANRPGWTDPAAYWSES